MRKIKNDPKKYIKRSSAYSPAKKSVKEVGDEEFLQSREREFLTAPIDKAGYITFTPRNRRRDM